ncbi:hypothetical protein BABINDRAFT_16602, partial [Babjeviella inositovora NRRL Y-12698]
DPIISMAKDPDLNKEKGKTDALIHIISGFPLTEKRVSRYCTLSFQVLRDLEKIELKTRSWQFMSLEINSEQHFESAASPVKNFNTQVAAKVTQTCVEIHKLLSQISGEIDMATRVIQTFTPSEYISDSGTLLTELTLRNIKLKSELNEKVSITYSKARLINIGSQLERLMTESVEDEASRSYDDVSANTIRSYKSFVASLLKQLNNAVSSGDQTGTTECIAVINDVEKMFEAIPREKDLGSSDMVFSELEDSQYIPPSSKSSSPPDSEKYRYHSTGRRNSISSLTTSTTLNRTTITEELPYLMNAFDDAKQVEEDVKKVQLANEEEEVGTKKGGTNARNSSTETYEKTESQTLHNPAFSLTNSLYSVSQMIKPLPLNNYLVDNNRSFLGRMGIKPQVVTAQF